MHLFNEILILLVVLLIVAGLGLGLLIALAIFILGKQRNLPPATNAKRPAINQSKRIVSSSVASAALSGGFFSLVFAARLIPIKENPIEAGILVILGIVLVAVALFYFSKI
jgi:hypothetical protein